MDAKRGFTRLRSSGRAAMWPNWYTGTAAEPRTAHSLSLASSTLATAYSTRETGSASTPPISAGWSAELRRMGALTVTEYAPRKKRPFQKKWVNKFPCGHTKIRKSCETCVALRGPRSRPIEVRFAEKFERRGPHECWPWTGSADRWGRGYILYEGKVRRAPRVAWALHHGVPFPEDKDACHTCDNPSCVNPAHIWPGTESDNQIDAELKGRQARVLTPALVREMRIRHAAGEQTADIARALGVAPVTARYAIHRKSWRYVA